MALFSAAQFDGQGDHHTPWPSVRQAFRKYIECGIFASGFAGARCDNCGHDCFVAYSWIGQSVCSSCKLRRMARGEHWTSIKQSLAADCNAPSPPSSTKLWRVIA
ncbi:transposase zinc-binding domain-containing protein [Rhodoferax sp. AJA081-3]|nr:transposase zinc-binding domain-containing protein [Rhodoferax sp. AJA081-3]